MEWTRIFQLERNYNNHSVQWPDQFRSDQQFKHAVKDIVQILLKHWQVWNIDLLSRKPVSGFIHSQGRKMVPGTQSKPPLTQVWTIPMNWIQGQVSQVLLLLLKTEGGKKSQTCIECLYFFSFPICYMTIFNKYWSNVFCRPSLDINKLKKSPSHYPTQHGPWLCNFLWSLTWLPETIAEGLTLNLKFFNKYENMWKQR